MKTLYFYLSILLFALVSCNREGDEDIKKTNAVDVYVSGIDDYKAAYWKNGIKTYLDGGYGYGAYKMQIDNNNLYLFGFSYEIITNQNFRNYCFWKNGVKTNLAQYLNVPENTQTQADNITINEMIVNNGDMYFYGKIKNQAIPSTNYQYEACVWKNGTKIYSYSINNNQSFFNAKNFKIYNNDLYYTVYEVNLPSSSTPLSKLHIFKNGIQTSSVDTTDSIDFLEKNNNLFLLLRGYIYAPGTTNIVGYNNSWKNITGNTQIAVPTSINNSFITSVNNFNDDLYYTVSEANNLNIYKNGSIFQFPYSAPNGFNTVDKFVIKDQNYYMIRDNNVGSSKKMFINNTEIINIPDLTKGCIYDILVVNQ